MNTPQIILRYISNLDGFFPSCVIGYMSKDPILNWKMVTQYMHCVSIKTQRKKDNNTHTHNHIKILSNHIAI